MIVWPREQLVYSSPSSRLYEQIVFEIEGSILKGILRPGDKLPSEREMCDRYEVSRTVIREAVRALREKGLVAIQPGRGTYVANDTSMVMRNSLGLMVKVAQEDSQNDLVQIRAILEPEIAALAAIHARPDHIEQLKKAVEDMDASMHDAERYIRADQTFHLILAKASGNVLIPLLIDPIVDLLWEQRKRIFLVKGGPRRGQFHHKRILDAVILKDQETARLSMQEHMAQVRADSINSQIHHNNFEGDE
jgi:DNA-binding FadR family transcriptional regulator